MKFENVEEVPIVDEVEQGSPSPQEPPPPTTPPQNLCDGCGRECTNCVVLWAKLQRSENLLRIHGIEIPGDVQSMAVTSNDEATSSQDSSSSVGGQEEHEAVEVEEEHGIRVNNTEKRYATASAGIVLSGKFEMGPGDDIRVMDGFQFKHERNEMVVVKPQMNEEGAGAQQVEAEPMDVAAQQVEAPAEPPNKIHGKVTSKHEHSGQKRKKKFSHASSLKTHVDKVKIVNLYKCTQLRCKEAFKTGPLLKNHEWSKHQIKFSGKPVGCRPCREVFTGRQSFSIHLRDVHGCWGGKKATGK